jgi:hypothetical protein
MVIVKWPGLVAGIRQSLPRLLIFRPDSLPPFGKGNDSVTMFPQKDFICGR